MPVGQGYNLVGREPEIQPVQFHHRIAEVLAAVSQKNNPIARLKKFVFHSLETMVSLRKPD